MPPSDSISGTAVVLVVDDDVHMRRNLTTALRSAGYETVEAGDGETALKLVERDHPNAILLDLEIPRLSGMDLLEIQSRRNANIPVIILSGKGNVQTAVRATRLGAYDFLEKPVNRERILLTLRNAMEKTVLTRQRDHLLEESEARFRIIGTSRPWRHIEQLIDRAASATAKVLIVGESGTGKQLIARAIHRRSARASQPFVYVNCAAIPQNLIESELFGHEKGAFTGATSRRVGKFARAAEGTILLDEIGDMSLPTQAKVLRVLEDGVYEPVGGSQSRRVDVRFIAATNRNLEEMIREGSFRQDLYYRLNVINIRVPPLRDRRDDVIELADHYLQRFAAENNHAFMRIEPDAIRLLTDYDWPGNVRQLRNTIERLVVLAPDDTIASSDVATALGVSETPIGRGDDVLTLRKACDRFERDYLVKRLSVNDWHIDATAQELGIDRVSLWRKMKRYEIER